MKIHTFGLISALLIKNAFAIQSPDEFFGQADDTPELVNFELEWTVEGHSDDDPSLPLTISEGEHITLRHNIKNNENFEFTVIGLGGSFRDFQTGEIRVNLTANSVGPVEFNSGDTHIIRQILTAGLAADTYFLSPLVYVTIGDQMKAIQAAGKVIVVETVPILIFEPKFLFLEVLFLGLAAFVGKAIYATFFTKYTVHRTATPRADSGKSTSYDPSWIPSHLQKLQASLPNKRARKAY